MRPINRNGVESFYDHTTKRDEISDIDLFNSINCKLVVYYLSIFI